MQKYDIFRKIGEGSFGEVLQCRNKHTNELVAVKKFKSTDADAATKELNEREITILRELQGKPGIVQLKEVFYDNAYQCLVFEYLSCDLLARFEACRSGFPEEQVRSYVSQLVRALHACHAIDVAHRDIKPENLLLNADYTVLKLCDFGCARKMKARMKLTDYIATRWYRAPELHLGTNNYDFSVDTWGVGCIMAEMVEGRPLFPCKDEAEGLVMIHRAFGLPSEMVQQLKTHPIAKWRSIVLPPVEKDFLATRFQGKLSAAALDFMSRLLRPDPKDRMSMAEALEHEYLCPDKHKEKGAKPKKKRRDAAKPEKGEKVDKAEKAIKKKQKEKRSKKPTLDEDAEYESDFEYDVNSPTYALNNDFCHTIKPSLATPQQETTYEQDFYEYADGDVAATPKTTLNSSVKPPPLHNAMGRNNGRRDPAAAAAALPPLSARRQEKHGASPAFPPMPMSMKAAQSPSPMPGKGKSRALPSPAVPTPQLPKRPGAGDGRSGLLGIPSPGSPLKPSPLKTYEPIAQFEGTLRRRMGPNPHSAPVCATQPRVALQHQPPVTVSGGIDQMPPRRLPALPNGHKVC